MGDNGFASCSTNWCKRRSSRSGSTTSRTTAPSKTACSQIRSKYCRIKSTANIKHIRYCGTLVFREMVGFNQEIFANHEPSQFPHTPSKIVQLPWLVLAICWHLFHPGIYHVFASPSGPSQVKRLSKTILASLESCKSGGNDGCSKAT